MARPKTHLTLTHYEVPSSEPAGPEAFVRLEDAEQAARNRGGSVEQVTRTFHVGQQVEVWAFGRLRPGVVKSVGRNLVRVAYIRNADGEVSERSFASHEIKDS